MTFNHELGHGESLRPQAPIDHQPLFQSGFKPEIQGHIIRRMGRMDLAAGSIAASYATAPQPPEQESAPRQDHETTAEYLTRLTTLEPKDREAFYTKLGRKADELRSLHFDSREALETITAIEEFLAWKIDGPPGSPLPDFVEHYNTRGMREIGHMNGDFFLHLSTITKPFALKQFRMLKGDASPLEPVVLDHLKKSDAYQFLLSFSESLPQERELTETERHVRRQQILGSIIGNSPLSARDVEKPAHSDFDQAGKANGLFLTAAARIDYETRLDTSPQQAANIQRLRDFFGPRIIEAYRNHFPYRYQHEALPSMKHIFTLLSQEKSGWESVLKPITGHNFDTPENTFLLEAVRDVISGNKNIVTIESYMEAIASRTATRLATQIHYGTKVLDVGSYQAFTWLVRDPPIPTDRNEIDSNTLFQRFHGGQAAFEQGWPEGLSTKSEAEACQNAELGEVLLDDCTPAEQNRFSSRVIMSMLSNPNKEHPNTDPSLRLRINSSDLQHIVRMGEEPFILGYDLVEQYQDGESHYFGFVRTKEDPYAPCVAALTHSQRRGCLDYLRNRRLDLLADAAENIPDLSVEDLRIIMRELNIYYFPPIQTSEAIEVQGGRAYVQCRGTDALQTGMLNCGMPGSAKGIGGTGWSVDGKITLAGHQVTLYVNNGKRYVLDATPYRTLDDPDFTPHIESSRQKDTETSNELSPSGALPSLEHPSPEPLRGPPEIDPITKAKLEIEQATTALQRVRHTFDIAARVRLGRENDPRYNSAETLYADIIRSTREHEPFRKVWGHIAYALPDDPSEFAIPAYKADTQQLMEHATECNLTLDYLRNILALHESKRAAFGSMTSDATLKSLITMMETVKRSYNKLFSARQTLGEKSLD